MITEQQKFLDAAAIAAMQVLIANYSPGTLEMYRIVPPAFDIAEAMLAERTRRYESAKEVQS